MACHFDQLVACYSRFRDTSFVKKTKKSPFCQKHQFVDDFKRLHLNDLHSDAERSLCPKQKVMLESHTKILQTVCYNQ